MIPVIAVPAALILVLLMLAGNLLFQDTIGMLHPIVFLAETLGLLLAYHYLRDFEPSFARWLGRKIDKGGK